MLPVNVSESEITDINTAQPSFKGKQADLIMIDLHQPNMQPIHNIRKNLVYSGSKQNVKMTMVAGKILYEDGEFFIGTDAARIYEKANEITQRIMSEI